MPLSCLISIAILINFALSHRQLRNEMRLNFDKPHEYVIRRIGGKRDEVLQNSLFIDKHSIHSIVPTLKKALLQLMLDGTL